MHTSSSTPTLLILACVPRLSSMKMTQPIVPSKDRLTLEEEEENNKWLVRILYQVLNSRDVDMARHLLAPDIEWWFHGPPSHQHMMRLLTGEEEDSSYTFTPLTFAAFGSVVLVEGGDPSLYWIHVWTVGPDGLINQVREYSDTSLTVTKLGGSSTIARGTEEVAGDRDGDIASCLSSTRRCVQLWRSRLAGDGHKKSMPELVLAI